MTKEKPTYTTVHWEPLDDPDKFRDADRVEEAQKIPLTDAQRTLQEQENEELKDAQQDKPGWKLKYEKERKLRQEAEGELTIVKGISVHMSPEMRDAKKEIDQLKKALALEKEDHQYDNLVHRQELQKLGK